MSVQSNNISATPKSNEIVRFFFASSSQGFAGFVTKSVNALM